jgi:hypothetical protein
MSDCVLPRYVASIKRKYQVMLFAALLAAVLVAALASTKVEQCQIIPGAFSTGFSSAFDVSRKVCRQTVLGSVAAAKIEDAANWALDETQRILAR